MTKQCLEYCYNCNFEIHEGIITYMPLYFDGNEKSFACVTDLIRSNVYSMDQLVFSITPCNPAW